MAEAPRRAHEGGAAHGALARHDRADGRDVVGVGRVTETDEETGQSRGGQRKHAGGP